MHGFACVLLHTTNYNHTHPTPTTHKKIMTTPLLINKAATLLLPPQTLNTHQKTSHRSHTTTKSTTTPLPTNHYPLNTPQNLSSPTTQTTTTPTNQSPPLHQPNKLATLPTHSQTYNAINQLALTNISSHLNSHHKKSHYPTTRLTAATSQTNHLPTHRDIANLTPTTPKS